MSGVLYEPDVSSSVPEAANLTILLLSSTRDKSKLGRLGLPICS